jgi:hypothetical protein
MLGSYRYSLNPVVRDFWTDVDPDQQYCTMQTDQSWAASVSIDLGRVETKMSIETDFVEISLK